MAGLELPIFELPLVLLPGEQVPLHIFEERYKRMVGTSLELGEPFGVVLRDDEGARSVGCTAIIDDVTERFEAPTEFVLPGENRVTAALDLARTIVRRAERASVTATTDGWLEVGSQVVPYLNRLADLCWTLARWQEDEFLPARAHPTTS
jgi:hypothetical protein